MKFLIFIAALCLAAKCVEPVDPGDVDDCDDACANIEKLGCDGAEGSPGEDEQFGTEDDKSCAQVCGETMALGVDMKPGCVAAAESCEAVEACTE
jgi:hypothetical protein